MRASVVRESLADYARHRVLEWLNRRAPFLRPGPWLDVEARCHLQQLKCECAFPVELDTATLVAGVRPNYQLYVARCVSRATRRAVAAAVKWARREDLELLQFHLPPFTELPTSPNLYSRLKVFACPRSMPIDAGQDLRSRCPKSGGRWERVPARHAQPATPAVE